MFGCFSNCFFFEIKIIALLIIFYYLCGIKSMGNHQSPETWEGGYRRAEIERQKVLLKERKEELEARRKRIQTLRRAAKKGAPSQDNLSDLAVVTQDGFGNIAVSGSGLGGLGGLGVDASERDRDIMDNDMDLNTETEVIKNHMEQLKK